MTFLLVMILMLCMLEELLCIGLRELELIRDSFNNRDKILQPYKRTINTGKLMANINRNTSYNERNIIS
jgi:hypothetical protein